MATNKPPLLLEPDDLEDHLSDAGLIIVDLSRPEVYAQAHVPGAVHVDYAEIIAQAPPAMGVLPGETQLTRVLSRIGLTPDNHVIAYDDEGGGRAARLLWTLECVGHSSYSLLNGGLHAWANEGHSLTGVPAHPAPSDYQARIRADAPSVERQYIIEHLSDPDIALLDARSPAEYRGEDVRANRGGHIPGAVNLDWLETMDRQRNLRLLPAGELESMLSARGVTADKTVIAYCQTHHRSAHTYIMLRSLGYSKVLGYPGAWSDWGNQPDTPVE